MLDLLVVAVGATLVTVGSVWLVGPVALIVMGAAAMAAGLFGDLDRKLR